MLTLNMADAMIGDSCSYLQEGGEVGGGGGGGGGAGAGRGGGGGTEPMALELEEKDVEDVEGSAEESPQSGTSSAARTTPMQYSKKRKRCDQMPKRPVPPFLIFSQEHRKSLKESQPELQLKDTSRLLSQMWAAMSDEEKQPYIQQCEVAKLRYSEELRQLGIQRKRQCSSMTSPQQHTEKKCRGKKRKQEEMDPLPPVVTAREKGVPSSAPPSSSSSARSALPTVLVPGTDIPVFSEQFLHYNKELEGQLIQLRRGNNKLQEEVSMLEQGLAESTLAVQAMREQVARQRQQNAALRSRLNEVRTAVATSFSSLSLPPNQEQCHADNVEEYLHHLAGLMKGDTPTELRRRVSSITAQLRDDIITISV